MPLWLSPLLLVVAVVFVFSDIDVILDDVFVDGAVPKPMSGDFSDLDRCLFCEGEEEDASTMD